MILYAILSAIGFGLANGIAQRYVRDLGIGATMFGRSLVSSIILAVLLIAFPADLSFSGVGIAALISGLGIAAVFAYYRALDVGDSGIVTPVANSAVIVTVIAAFLLFGEALGIFEYVLIAAIVFGGVLLSREPGGVARGVPWALVAMLFWGLAYALLVIPIRIIGPIATPLIGEIIAVIAGGIWMLVAGQRIPRSAILPLAAIGGFIALGVGGFAFALQTVPAGIVAAISAANPAVTALYMRLVHGEQLTLAQRLGSFVVIAGVVLLSL